MQEDENDDEEEYESGNVKQIVDHLFEKVKENPILSSQMKQEEDQAKPTRTCDVCGKECTLQCSRCKAASYCCKEHQVLHWQFHKKFCKIEKAKLSSQSSKDIFEEFNIFSEFSTKQIKPFIIQNWNHYFSNRKLLNEMYDFLYSRNEAITMHQKGQLTYPLTIIHTLQKLNIHPKQGINRMNYIYIICTGETPQEAYLDEQTNQTQYWSELGNFYPGSYFNIVYFVPDMYPFRVKEYEGSFISDQVTPTYIQTTFEQWHIEKHSLKWLRKLQIQQDDIDNIKPILVVMFNPRLGFSQKYIRRDWSAEFMRSRIIDAKTSKFVDIWKKQMDEVAALNTPTLITMVNDDDDLESTKRYIDEKNLQIITTPPYQLNPFSSPWLQSDGFDDDESVDYQKLDNQECINILKKKKYSWEMINYEFMVVQGLRRK
ncbi:MAG: hypothetical protein EZS28_013154 [Streblomastix strix]|uniref:MYND-type domain-containing protein n=1 Tax=Streblomastix strix TaxID=222440 RepID=A0A5J4W8X7_9EUKA|nr:MAG: hypothetical protein EZS28_013154 [Streblomastix strix]